MLNSSELALIKASVPVLQTRGEDITRHFYQILFRDYPQVKAFFNQAHQAQGTQPRALAGAVLAYAAHIDRLEAIAGALPAIINKHVSLGIKPEHYPIVGTCLLQAIGEVLGDAATPELVGAWGKAYGQLADLLIAAEENLYQQIENQNGGWRGTRKFVVSRKQHESEVITSFYLKPADNGAVPHYLPGQYLTVVLNVGGDSVRRNYSLSDAPGNDYLRISVKRETNGVVSNHLHDTVNEGDLIDVMPPCGEFVLDDSDAPLLLIAGGVGITPLLSMLKIALLQNRKVTLVQAARNGTHHGFRDELAALAEKHAGLQLRSIYDEALEGDTPDFHGRIDASMLNDVTGVDRNKLQVYLLGPKPFMQSVYRDVLKIGIEQNRIHVEFFGPKEELAA